MRSLLIAVLLVGTAWAEEPKTPDEMVKIIDEGIEEEQEAVSAMVCAAATKRAASRKLVASERRYARATVYAKPENLAEARDLLETADLWDRIARKRLRELKRKARPCKNEIRMLAGCLVDENSSPICQTVVIQGYSMWVREAEHEERGE